MKICPHCQTRYTDDTLQFCLQDGAALTSDNAETSMPTVAFNTETETVVKPRPTDQIQFDPQTSNQAEPKKSNTALIVAATVLATLLLAAIGVGAWFYFANKKEIATDANVKNSFPDNSDKNKTENSGVFPPSNAAEKPTVKPTATPAPDFDPEKVKSEVSGTVNSWKSLAESRDLSAYMNNYADSIDYYNKKGASIGTVRADKQKAFTTFDNIEINLSNMRVTPDASGEKATAVFDKEWFFENAEKTSEGKVQTQLQLKKIGGAWKITSEKDLKVYYVK